MAAHPLAVGVDGFLLLLVLVVGVGVPGLEYRYLRLVVLMSRDLIILISCLISWISSIRC